MITEIHYISVIISTGLSYCMQILYFLISASMHTIGKVKIPLIFPNENFHEWEKKIKLLSPDFVRVTYLHLIQNSHYNNFLLL